MSDPSNKAAHGPGDDPSHEDAPNMDATFVPNSSGNSADVETDYTATITGMPLPVHEDDDFEGNPSDGDTPDAEMRTFVPAALARDLRSARSTDKVDATNADITLDAPISTDKYATQVSEQQAVADASDSFSGTVIAQPVEETDYDSTVINESGNKLASERSAKPSETVAERQEQKLQAGTPTVGLSQSGSHRSSGSKSDSHSAGSGTGSNPESGSRSGGTDPGSKVLSQIWTSPTNSSLDELITIRKRPVSGSGSFAPAEDADFEIVEKLAEGGMGVVYIARQRSLNRELAIKTLKSGSDAFSGTVGKSKSSKAVSRADRQKREMFLSEALVTANLVHPNIIPIHELAETGEGTPYYVMKRVHGTPWNKRITAMTLVENLEVLHKVCDAVAYAHHHGVINRDLKPENIMLGEFGEVLVLDWGLAVPAPHAAEMNFRSPVASFGAGTPAYMSPELWSGPPEAIGECSDIYLLGAILYEIVTGMPPHDFPRPDKKGGRSDVWKLIDDVLRHNVIRPTQESGELLDIAMKAMRTNPDERFGSVLELQFAVRNFQRHEESRRLSARATELIDRQSNVIRDYYTCQTACALYEESLRTWPQNGLAQNGLRSTRLLYANLAASKGDYDLGLQVSMQENDPEFIAISRKLRKARQIRSSIKWTALTALLCVALLGAKAIRDHGIITNLEEESKKEIAKATLAQEVANTAKAEADSARKAAEHARSEKEKSRAETEIAKLETVKATTETARAKVEADEAVMLAQKEKMNADIAKADAAQAKREAEEANQKAEVADQKAKAADAKVLAAIEQQSKAEAATTAAIARQKEAEVETQSQLIRGLTLNENFADALREINRLLDGEVLASLPENLRQRRVAELRAQRDQLLKRARPTEAPVQSQVMNGDRTLLAQGDASGLVVVMKNPGPGMEWPNNPLHQLQIPQGIEKMAFVSLDEILIAAGDTLFVWKVSEPDARQLNGHTAAVKAIDVNKDLAITADISGHIIVWRLSDWKHVVDLNANTNVFDLALVPESLDFLYAGTRGGQSSEVMAYRLLTETNPPSLQRLGQLRASRDHNYPPSELSVSPDGKLLIVSNRTNGSLFVLKARQPGVNDAVGGFPFSQPAELQKNGDMSWLVTQHSRPVNDLQWSSDGTQLLTASDDRRIGVWSTSQIDSQVNNLIFRRYLRGHGARVMQAGFLNAEASRISSTSADGFSRLWDLETIDDDSLQIRKAFNLSQRLRPSAKAMLCAMPAQPDSKGTSDTTISEGDQFDESESSHLLHAANSVHQNSIRALTYNSDGRRLISGAEDGSILLWDMTSRSVVSGPSGNSKMLANEQFREGHESNISRMLQIGQDHSILATAGFDGTLRLWNMQTSNVRLGVQQQVIQGLGLVNAFAVSPDGQYLVTSEVNENESIHGGECRLWRLSDLLSHVVPTAVKHLRGSHRSEITSISVSKNSQRIATAGRDGIITIWDVESANILARRRTHAKDTIITSLVWLGDETVLSAGLDGKVARWAVVPNSNSKGLNRPDKDEQIAGASDPAAFHLEQVASYERDRTPVEQVSVSPDETQLLVISVDTDRGQKKTHYYLDHWSLDNPQIHKRIIPAIVAGKKPASLSSAQWSEDSQRVLLCADGVVQVFDASTWKVTRVFSAGTSGVRDAQFLRGQGASDENNSDNILTFDGTSAALWDLASGKHRISFSGPFPVSAVECAELSGQRLIFSAGNTLRVFDGNESSDAFGRPLFHLQKAHRGPINSIAVNPTDGAQILTAGEDGRILLWKWSVAEQALLPEKELAHVNGAVTNTKWSHDAKQVSFVTREGLVGLADIENKSVQHLAINAKASVQFFAIDISRDAPLIAVAGRYAGTEESIGWVINTAQFSRPGVSNETNNDPMKTPEAPNQGTLEKRIECAFSGHAAGGISSVQFVGGTPYLVSGGQDGSLILWNWKDKLTGAVPTAYEAYRFFTEGQLTAHLGPVTSLSISADNELTSAGEDGRITVWNLPLLQPAQPN